MAHVDREKLAYFLSKLQSWVASYAPSKDVATPYSPGLMSASDKAKLDGVATDASLNAASANPVRNSAVTLALQNLEARTGALEQAGSTTYTYKGSVPTYADLPSSGNQVGDVYDVLTAPDDGSWAWNGTAWNKLSGFVDLSALATKDVATPTSDGLMSASDKASFNALMQGFVPLWSSAQDYSAGMLIRGSDGLLYLSKQQSGPGTSAFARNPVDDGGAYWGRVSSDDAALVHLDGAETVSGQKTFSQPIVGDVTGSAAYAAESGGAALWSSASDYAAGAFVRGSDGKLYYAVQASGPGSSGASDPVQDDGTHWSSFVTSDAGVVHLDGDETIGGVKTFTDPVEGDVLAAAAASGAVPRLLTERAADWISVKDYGAKGDGATDDSAAFAAAALASGGGSVYVPDGVYFLGSDVSGLFWSDGGASFVGTGRIHHERVTERLPDPCDYSFHGLNIGNIPGVYGSVGGRYVMNQSIPQGIAYDRFDGVLYFQNADNSGVFLYAVKWSDIPSERVLLGTNFISYPVGGSQVQTPFVGKFAHQNLSLYRPTAADPVRFFCSTYFAEGDPTGYGRMIRWDYRNPQVAVVEREWKLFDDSVYSTGYNNFCASFDGKYAVAKTYRLSDGKFFFGIWKISDLLNLSGSDATGIATYVPAGTTISSQALVCDGRLIYNLRSGVERTVHYLQVFDFSGALVYQRESIEGYNPYEFDDRTKRWVTNLEGEALAFVRSRGRYVLMLGTQVRAETYDGSSSKKYFYLYDLTSQDPNERNEIHAISKYYTTEDFTDSSQMDPCVKGFVHCNSGTMSDWSDGQWIVYTFGSSRFGLYGHQICFRINTLHDVRYRAWDGDANTWGGYDSFAFYEESKNNFGSGDVVSHPLTVHGTWMGDERDHFNNISNANNYTLLRCYSHRDTEEQSCTFLTRFRRNVDQGSGDCYATFNVEVQENGRRTPLGVFYSGHASGGDVSAFHFMPHPAVRDVSRLGSGINPWNMVYASDGPWTGSDARLKTSVAGVDEALMRAWGKVRFCVFQKADAYAAKGAAARLHVGVVAQEVQAAFASEGLDASRYGLFCHDVWEDEWDEEEVVDAEAVLGPDGEVVVPARTHTVRRKVRDAGDVYGIRYTEALALECAYQRWLGERRDAEIAALKAKLGM